MRILIIEDDRELCRALKYALEGSGYTVDVCHEGDDGLRYMRENAHDLVLLDRMLPRMSGTELLERARAAGVRTPVLMATALGEIEERVEGLDAGADDYIIKPYAIEELLARIRALARRPRGWEVTDEVRCGNTVLKAAQGLLQDGARSCTLSRRECDLLEMLMRHEDKTLPRGTLFTHVWGVDAPVEEGNLENYISFLRRRLRTVNSALCIKTVRGVGYRLEAPDA